MGRRGAAGRRLGRVVVDGGPGQRAGQVEAPDPGCDRGVEGQLPCSDGGGGAGLDGQRRRGGELAAETRRFVIDVLATSIILIGGKKQLQGPERGKGNMIGY